jgi:hypothetical protein
MMAFVQKLVRDARAITGADVEALRSHGPLLLQHAARHPPQATATRRRRRNCGMIPP